MFIADDFNLSKRWTHKTWSFESLLHKLSLWYTCRNVDDGRDDWRPNSCGFHDARVDGCDAVAAEPRRACQCCALVVLSGFNYIFSVFRQCMFSLMKHSNIDSEVLVDNNHEAYVSLWAHVGQYVDYKDSPHYNTSQHTTAHSAIMWCRVVSNDFKTCP